MAGADVVGGEVAGAVVAATKLALVGAVSAVVVAAGSPVEHATTIARDAIARSNLFIRRPPLARRTAGCRDRHDTPF
ncbi:MAG TPA: hypothetical protein VHM94_05175, partial [Acidimicrobiia bacterium]|nr:hypothetical protein [Acidimicrobiia bacterium]